MCIILHLLLLWHFGSVRCLPETTPARSAGLLPGTPPLRSRKRIPAVPERRDRASPMPTPPPAGYVAPAASRTTLLRPAAGSLPTPPALLARPRGSPPCGGGFAAAPARRLAVASRPRIAPAFRPKGTCPRSTPAFPWPPGAAPAGR